MHVVVWLKPHFEILVKCIFISNSNLLAMHEHAWVCISPKLSQISNNNQEKTTLPSLPHIYKCVASPHDIILTISHILIIQTSIHIYKDKKRYTLGHTYMCYINGQGLRYSIPQPNFDPYVPLITYVYPLSWTYNFGYLISPSYIFLFCVLLFSNFLFV